MTTFEPEIRCRKSPNFGPRRGGRQPDMVVLHYTGMETAEAALDRLCSPASEVSAHYLIERGGVVWSLVEERERAWHAGASGWGVESDINSCSIGIELENPGRESDYRPFPESQIRALEALLDQVNERWRVAPERIVGHACVAPGRKVDPGEKLDWRRLALQGRAVWLDPEVVGQSGEASARRFQEAALRFGYSAPKSDEWDERTLAVWRAFTMRFLPQMSHEGPCAWGVRHLERLAERWPVKNMPGAASGAGS